MPRDCRWLRGHTRELTIPDSGVVWCTAISLVSLHVLCFSSHFSRRPSLAPKPTAQDERARGHPSHAGAWSDHVAAPAEPSASAPAAGGVRNATRNRGRAVRPTKWRCTIQPLSRVSLVLGYDREASDSHAAYLPLRLSG